MKNQIKHFGIHIKVSDFDRSCEFYRKLGLEEKFAYGPTSFLSTLSSKVPSAKEKYKGIVFEIGNSLLEIGEDHIAVKKEVFNEKIKSSKVSAMIEVESLKNSINLCKKNHIRIAVPPRKFPWGTRELVIKDPDGFVLVFIEKIKE